MKDDMKTKLINKISRTAKSLLPDISREEISLSEIVANQGTTCYICCSPFQPYRLNKNEEYTIGRHLDNKLVLPSKDVSRFHAVIKWQDEGFVVADKGSANGIVVNDQTVKQHVLKNGDVISIGLNEIKYQEVSAGSPENKADRDTIIMTVGDKKNPRDTVIMQAPAENMTSIEQDKELSEAIQGDLKFTNFFSLMQMLGNDEISGCLQITKEHRESRIYFLKGKIIHCTDNEIKGREAFLEVAQNSQAGKFRFLPEAAPQEVTMSDDVEWILFEAARVIDEASK